MNKDERIQRLADYIRANEPEPEEIANQLDIIADEFRVDRRKNVADLDKINTQLKKSNKLLKEVYEFHKKQGG